MAFMAEHSYGYQDQYLAQIVGGDGTASWLLGVVSDLKLAHPPSIATVPLGTGNNLPFSFGWGKKNPGTDHLSVKSFLDQVLIAKEMKIASWHIMMRMRAPKEGSCDPIAPLELPHSLHAVRRVSNADSLNMARRELNDPENAVIGAFAGAITGAITTPLDVLKTRLMVQVQQANTMDLLVVHRLSSEKKVLLLF